MNILKITRPNHPVDRTRDPWALTDYSLRTPMASYKEAYILNRNLALQL